MATHRVRRWFQFGILDLMILTTVVAVVVSLLQPPQAKANTAAPWIIGDWLGDDVAMRLYPDRYYCIRNEHEWSNGFGWTIARASGVENAFVLECGKLRFLVRSEWGSGLLDLLNSDGTVQSILTQPHWSQGPMRDGSPHGIWAWVSALRSQVLTMKYRNGEIIDVHDAYGVRDWVVLNWMRKIRGLTLLTEGDFRNEGKTTLEETSP